jgi:hypothetical protein
MNRRNVLKTGLAAGLTGATTLKSLSTIGAAAEGNHYYELRTYQLRNDLTTKRIHDFFQNHFLPMTKRQDFGPVGCFTVASGQYTPSLILLLDYKSLGEMQAAHARMEGDKEFLKAWQEFEAAAEMPYVRYESQLLKAFDGHVKLEIPAPNKMPRLFELRTYESRNRFSLKNKLAMFNQEEIKIFRDCGFAPIFFGESVIGTRQPALTYLVAFDDMAAREAAWAKFINSGAFKKIRVLPGWTDPEAVSNIYGSFLRPTAYSQIK